MKKIVNNWEYYYDSKNHVYRGYKFGKEQVNQRNLLELKQVMEFYDTDPNPNGAYFDVVWCREPKREEVKC